MSGSVGAAIAVVAAPPGPSQRAGRQRGMLIASRADEGAPGSHAPAGRAQPVGWEPWTGDRRAFNSALVAISGTQACRTVHHSVPQFNWHRESRPHTDWYQGGNDARLARTWLHGQSPSVTIVPTSSSRTASRSPNTRFLAIAGLRIFDGRTASSGRQWPVPLRLQEGHFWPKGSASGQDPRSGRPDWPRSVPMQNSHAAHSETISKLWAWTAGRPAVNRGDQSLCPVCA
jgi:hypothetical protein